jgi:hypothetical protein
MLAAFGDFSPYSPTAFWTSLSTGGIKTDGPVAIGTMMEFSGTDWISVSKYGFSSSVSGSVNATALQSAIDASASAKRIIIPDGNFTITGNIVINHPCVLVLGSGTYTFDSPTGVALEITSQNGYFSIYGNGSQNSTIRHDIDTDTIKFSGSNTRNCVLKGFKISSGPIKNLGNGISIPIGVDMLFEDIYIYHTYNGFYVPSSLGGGLVTSHFNKCRVDNASNDGFSINRATSTTFTSTYANACAGWGYNLLGVAYSSLHSTASDGCGNAGVSGGAYNIGVNANSMPSQAITLNSAGFEQSKYYGFRITGDGHTMNSCMGYYSEKSNIEIYSNYKSITVNGGMFRYAGYSGVGVTSGLTAYALDVQASPSYPAAHIILNDPYFDNATHGSTNRFKYVNDPLFRVNGFIRDDSDTTKYRLKTISSGGGRVKDTFYANDIIDVAPYTSMSRGITGFSNYFVASDAGSILSITVNSSEDVTNGSVYVIASINGTSISSNVSDSAILSSVNPNKNIKRYMRGEFNFNSGDLIGIMYKTDVGTLPSGSNDIVVELAVEY